MRFGGFVVVGVGMMFLELVESWVVEMFVWLKGSFEMER